MDISALGDLEEIKKDKRKRKKEKRDKDESKPKREKREKTPKVSCKHLTLIFINSQVVGNCCEAVINVSIKRAKP